MNVTTPKIVSNCKGFGVAELLVSVMIFGIAILAIASFTNLTFANLGAENRASSSMRELRSAIALMSAELRMSSNVSPYLPGNTPSSVNCTAQISATATSIKFLVVHDDSAAAGGIQPYYVGYTYDAATRQLRRGEIPGVSITGCGLPAGDPVSGSYARVVADRLFPWDADKNGVADPVFSYSGGVLTVNLAVQAEGAQNFDRSQGLSTKIFARTT